MKFSGCLLALGLSSAPQLAEGWWDNGHALASQVGVETLLKAGKEAEVEVLNYLLSTNREFPLYNTLARAATWADKIKAATPNGAGYGPLAPNFRVFNELHYFDLPARIDLATADAGLTLLLKNTTLLGAQTAINGAITSTINKGSDGVAKPLPETRGTLYTHDLSLRLLLHVVGDIHMPLHTVAIFDDAFCNTDKSSCGDDQGGNYFTVNYSRSSLAAQTGLPSNLHALWDSGCLLMNKDIEDTTDEELEQEARKIMLEYPEDYFTNLKYPLDFNVTKTFLESYKIAVVGADEESNVFVDKDRKERARVYPPGLIDTSMANWEKNVRPQIFVTDEYLDWCASMSRRRVALAGYRFARIFNDMAHSFPESLLIKLGDALAGIEPCVPIGGPGDDDEASPRVAAVLATGLLLFAIYNF